jgi:hypothetical protein
LLATDFLTFSPSLSLPYLAPQDHQIRLASCRLAIEIVTSATTTTSVHKYSVPYPFRTNPLCRLGNYRHPSIIAPIDFHLATRLRTRETKCYGSRSSNLGPRHNLLFIYHLWSLRPGQNGIPLCSLEIRMSSVHHDLYMALDPAFTYTDIPGTSFQVVIEHYIWRRTL